VISELTKIFYTPIIFRTALKSNRMNVKLHITASKRNISARMAFNVSIKAGYATVSKTVLEAMMK
jgi:hypothetical protein